MTTEAGNRNRLLRSMVARTFFRRYSNCVLAWEVYTHESWTRPRTIDCIVATKSDEMIAIEFKQSRSDFKRELQQPTKWMAFDWCNQFYIATFDNVWIAMEDLITKGDIRMPAEWGVLVATPNQTDAAAGQWSIRNWKLREPVPAPVLKTAEMPKKACRWFYIAKAGASGRASHGYKVHNGRIEMSVCETSKELL